MLPRSLEAIDKLALDGLVLAQVREGRTIEYKRELPAKWDERSRVKLLHTVMAFANAGGGDIVYGVVEERDEIGKSTGLPKEITGLAGLNRDEVTRTLEPMIRSGLDPRVVIRLKWVEGFPAGPALVIHIPKSYAGPHMLTGASRFYARGDAENIPLDVHQIRSAFLGSEEIPERIRRFRAERLALISSDEASVRLPAGPKVVMHLIPYSSLEPGARCDLTFLETRAHDFPPLMKEHLSSWSPRYNFDGIAVVGTSHRLETTSYLQLFRNGVVEVVSNEVILPDESCRPGFEKTIASTAFEKTLILGLRDHLALLRQMDIAPPVAVLLTLLGVEGYRLVVPVSDGRPYVQTTQHRIDRDVLLLPESIIQDPEEHADKILRPAFDVLWQAVGQPRDLYYRDNEAGRWIESPGGQPIF